MIHDTAKIEEKEIAHAHYVKTMMVQKKEKKKKKERLPNQIHVIHVLGSISKVIVHLKEKFVISVENQDIYQSAL